MTIDANEAIENVNFPHCEEGTEKNLDFITEPRCDATDLALFPLDFGWPCLYLDWIFLPSRHATTGPDKKTEYYSSFLARLRPPKQVNNKPNLMLSSQEVEVDLRRARGGCRSGSTY